MRDRTLAKPLKSQCFISLEYTPQQQRAPVPKQIETCKNTNLFSEEEDLWTGAGFCDGQLLWA
ncbi:MAG: hypothetical protein A2W93_13310 [Bacteroidetes bacterium GWF2_43_63]|nr:MAG: hypothetical protein A2W94_03300 [Bacteroidetes bacterium GWE2_42_42]OFY55159.1 MAG: hypothetical protein A2W93_13310 [Bacteroidetes bacterium GWF2_43_63]HBG70219.1 hypothetical protein [Bacteroidales bacterium]HCB63108.1 hypothetical protein [Bacteroidales bacterium]HCY22673.1 hypothetical protein [Bacteroidales bacterium]